MFKLASSIGFALALADLKRRIHHWVRSGIFGAIGFVLLLIGLCFLLVALHLYLSGLLNPIASAAIIGGVLVLFALILFFVASRPMDRTAKAASAEQPVGQIGDALREGMARLGQAAGSEGSPLRNPLLQAAGVALVVGYFLGRRGRRPPAEKD
jgi:amino acid transporter